MIAAGGGALTFPENAAALAATGVIVLLEVSPETVLRRLEGDDSPPLLRRPDKAEAVRELMELPGAVVPGRRLGDGERGGGPGRRGRQNPRNLRMRPRRFRAITRFPNFLLTNSPSVL